MKSRLLHRIAAATLFTALAAPLSLVPQEKGRDQVPAKDSAQYQYRTGTNLVLVPVVVTDKQGLPVSGLTVGDFELKQDGTIQKIASLEEVVAEATRAQKPTLPPDQFTNQLVTERPKKLEILTLDLVNTSFEGQHEATKGLINFLAKSSSDDALVALVVFRTNGVHIIHDFTSDPAVLTGVLKKLQANPVLPSSPTAYVPGDLNAEAAQLSSILAGSLNDGSITASRLQLGAAAAVMDVGQSSQNAWITLECFQAAAQYFASVPGRKSLIWASTGFNVNLGSMPGQNMGGLNQVEWDRTTRILQEANIAVYPVDVSGLLPVSAQQATNSVRNLQVIQTAGPEGGVRERSASLGAVEAGVFLGPAEQAEQRHQVMKILAEQTGGLAYYNLNDGSELFRRASLDSGHYYMLTYSTKGGGKNEWRKLSVKVRREGVLVRHRSGFFFRNPVQDSDSARQADLQTALTSNVNFTALPLNGAWQQVEPAGDKRKIHFLLSIPPGVTAVDTEQENRISLEIAVSAVDANGKEAARIRQKVDQKLPPASVSQFQAMGLGYPNALTLPPGQYNVHFVIRDNLRGLTGSVVAPLTVQ